MAALINLGILYFLREYIGLWYLLSGMIAFLASLIPNYLFQKTITFMVAEGSDGVRFSKFLLVSVVGLCMYSILLFILTDIVVIWYLWSAAIAIAFVFFWNFFMNKSYTFSCAND